MLREFWSPWLPMIVCWVLLMGIALYLHAKGIRDPRALFAKNSTARLLGVVFLLLAGLLVSAFYAFEYRNVVEEGSFVVLDKMLVVPLALVFLGMFLLIFGSYTQRIIPIGPDVHRLSVVQWVLLVIFCVMCFGAIFGFPKLIEALGWQVRRLP